MTIEAGADPWIHFVHGTTTTLWDGEPPIRGIGGGDFGMGFYTFEDANWGRQAASTWARRKAADQGGRPILVRTRMRRSTFVALDREDVSDQRLSDVVARLRPHGVSGVELVVGAVARRDDKGRQTPDRRLPPQFKFEGSGVAKLDCCEVMPAQWR